MKARLVYQTLDERRNFTRDGDPAAAMDVGQRAMIKKWLDTMGVEGYTVNDDMTVDVAGTVHIGGKSLREFPSYVRFGEVRGNFFCGFNGLTSLRGCPKRVSGDFSCSRNPLASLEGCPEAVGGSFYCYVTGFAAKDIIKLCKVDGNIFGA